MKIAVISDIHANLEALEAVLLDARAMGVSEYVCLGDITGYGPDPNEVVTRLALMRMPCVKGNHEQGLSRPPLLARFSAEAQASLKYATDHLSPSARLWLNMLPRIHLAHGARFVHGAPPQSIMRYITQCPPQEWDKRFDSYPEEPCFTGHTHIQTLIRRPYKGETLASMLLQGRHTLPENSRTIIGVGSVGQPRGQGKKAEYVVWSPADRTIVARRVPYDTAKTIRKMIARGLPPGLITLLE